MLNTPKNDNTRLNVRSGERFGHFFYRHIIIHYNFTSPERFFYKLGKGNAVYESNIFETKSHAYINHSEV